ncbi:hypothetical protein [Aquipuribacter nitratireducens]|uniref:Uncharacterized protein n=1 Tax=Aquipuribacter nitratireducens TaxID=650104 RepID=A0ABW0GL59_9MICO
MSTTAAPPPPLPAAVPQHPRRRGLRDLLTRVWHEVRPTSGAGLLVCATGLVLAGAGVAHLGVQAVDGGAWSGPVSWRKPVVFGLSLGILLVTVGVVLRWVSGSVRRWVAGLLAVGSVVEYVGIASQRWRGVPSHFNEATAYDSAVFGVMAWAVGVIVLAVALLLVVTALPRRFTGGGALRAAVLAGLGAVLVSSWVGGRMIAEGTEVVAATGAVPDSVVFGAQGSAKLFHAVGQHGLQLLLAVAVLLRLSGAPARRSLTVTLLAAAGYAGVLAGVGASALRGESWLALPRSLLLPGLPGALLLAVAGTVTAVHVVRWSRGLADEPAAVVG